MTLKKKKNLFQHSHHQLYLKLIKVSEFKNHIYHKLHAWVKKKSLTFNIKIWFCVVRKVGEDAVERLAHIAVRWHPFLALVRSTLPSLSHIKPGSTGPFFFPRRTRLCAQPPLPPIPGGGCWHWSRTNLPEPPLHEIRASNYGSHYHDIGSGYRSRGSWNILHVVHITKRFMVHL